MKNLDVIVAGDLFVDLIMSGFPAWPQPGTETFAREFHRDIGGGAAISACGLAKLGSRAAVLGVVGKDNGDWLKRRLETSGVKTSQIRFHDAEPTAVTVAISTPEERSYLTYRGANRLLEETLAEATAAGLFKDVRHVHLACAPDLGAAAALLTAIKTQGCSISLDVGWHEAWLTDPRATALLPLLDIFLPNEREARQMTDESGPVNILRKLESAGARRVALKLGSDGAALLWDGTILRAEPCPVKAIDTTGAGDCFDAGLLHFWLRGESPAACLRAANFCGAASTQAHGGIAGFPGPERVKLELTKSL